MAGTTNTGVVNYISNPVASFPKNSITVDIFGNVFYRNYDFGAGDDTGVYWNDEKEYSEATMLFFAISIEKSLFGKFSFGTKLRSSQSLDFKIYLPTKNGNIDFEFMENFIAELEAERLAELEAYLSTTGLRDYTLTSEEERILREFECGEFEWGEFKIEELFEKLNLRFLKSIFDKESDVSKEKTLEFNLPLVNAKEGDNGVMYYGRSQDFEGAEMTIDVVSDGAISTGNVYSQPQKTGVLYNAYLIKPKFSANEKLLHFFTSTIQKSIKLKFGYENKAGWAKVKEEGVQLPIQNNQPDYAIMEILISAIQKLVIKDVVLYTDRKIEATKSIVEKR